METREEAEYAELVEKATKDLEYLTCSFCKINVHDIGDKIYTDGSNQLCESCLVHVYCYKEHQ